VLQDELYRAIVARRSVRRYDSTPLDEPTLARVRAIVAGVRPHWGVGPIRASRFAHDRSGTSLGVLAGCPKRSRPQAAPLRATRQNPARLSTGSRGGRCRVELRQARWQCKSLSEQA